MDSCACWKHMKRNHLMIICISLGQWECGNKRCCVCVCVCVFSYDLNYSCIYADVILWEHIYGRCKLEAQWANPDRRSAAKANRSINGEGGKVDEVQGEEDEEVLWEANPICIQESLRGDETPRERPICQGTRSFCTMITNIGNDLLYGSSQLDLWALVPLIDSHIQSAGWWSRPSSS